jgi:hypothetical protein
METMVSKARRKQYFMHNNYMLKIRFGCFKKRCRKK